MNYELKSDISTNNDLYLDKLSKILDDSIHAVITDYNLKDFTKMMENNSARDEAEINGMHNKTMKYLHREFDI